MLVFVISENCANCGTCEDSCPVLAISRGENHYEINKDICIGCGNCVVTCPVAAVYSID